jgi:predicted glycoside hydrolase/deacetylase ChbG (UPF0249 family)
MLIINADDWGRSVAETDAALRCQARQRISSATAMVFMRDSARAADLALVHGLSVGLHLNYSQIFECPPRSEALQRSQQRICRFMRSGRYASLLYHPGLAQDFEQAYQGQREEFERLYGRAPTHVDGHHHKHLCGNVLLGQVIPAGCHLRRHLSFWPGEKSALNRAYRHWADTRLARRYRSTDQVFALSQCLHGERLVRVLALARRGTVELFTHPVMAAEMACLLSDGFMAQCAALECGSYAAL